MGNCGNQTRFHSVQFPVSRDIMEEDAAPNGNPLLVIHIEDLKPQMDNFIRPILGDLNTSLAPSVEYLLKNAFPGGFLCSPGNNLSKDLVHGHSCQISLG